MIIYTFNSDKMSTATLPKPTATTAKDYKMSAIVESIIKAGDLPKQVRGDIDPDITVSVSIKPVELTENGFTHKEEEEILKIAKEAREGKNLSGPFSSAKEAINYLRTK